MNGRYCSRYLLRQFPHKIYLLSPTYPKGWISNLDLEQGSGDKNAECICSHFSSTYTYVYTHVHCGKFPNYPKIFTPPRFHIPCMWLCSFPPSESVLDCGLACIGQKNTAEVMVHKFIAFCSRGLEHFCFLSKNLRLCCVNKPKLLCWRWEITQTTGSKRERTQSRSDKLFCSWPQMHEAA